jgi:hypothetical protein
MHTRLRGRSAVVAFAASLALALVTAGAASAAPIPVTTCGQVLSIPGATYVLQNDLYCPGGIGVEITAPYITFDLNGHKIVHTGATFGQGVFVKGAGTKHVTVKNGRVQNWFQGVMVANGAEAAYITNMIAVENVRGIEVHGNDNKVHFNLTVASRLSAGDGLSGIGIYAQANNTQICRNRSSRNKRAGIYVDGNANVLFCNTTENNGSEAALLLGNVSDGIVVQRQDNVLHQNTCTKNFICGIFVITNAFQTTRDNLLLKNRVGGNLGCGIEIQDGAIFNTMKKNIGIGNGGTDMLDGNADCDDNTWVDNVFVTANQDCIQ